MELINLRVKANWIWSKLADKKYFSIHAKSLDDICSNNQIILKQNQILKIKFAPKSNEELKPLQDQFFNSEINLQVQPDFTIVDCDGFDCKQFTAVSFQ